MEIDVATWLQKEFAERRSRNSRYSERAFARSLGLSAGFLNHLLQRKKKLGPARALDIARRLNWSELKTREFIGLTSTKSDGHSVKTEDFQEMADWYFFAMIELTDIAPVRDAADVRRRLGLSLREAEYALGVLARAGLLVSENGRYKRAHPEYDTPALSSASIRKFHRQSLEKAVLAVDEQTPAERDLRSLTISFDSNRIEDVRTDLTRMMKQIERKYANGKKDSVYQLNFAFHRLDKETP